MIGVTLGPFHCHDVHQPNQQPPEWMGAMMAGSMCLYWVGLMVLIVFSTYLQVRWIFVFALIADKKNQRHGYLRESCA